MTEYAYIVIYTTYSRISQIKKSNSAEIDYLPQNIYYSGMNQWIDLTRLMEDDMPVYPGDNPVFLSQNCFLTDDKYNNSLITTGMHSGTHIDGPRHLLENGLFLYEIPPERFSGKAVLLDVSGRGRAIGIKKTDMPDIQTIDIIVFRTGWGGRWGKGDYFTDYPVFHESWVEIICGSNIKMILFDSPSPDRYPFPVHTGILSNGILIGENLTNLDSLPERSSFELYAFPLKVKADSAPARILACL